MEAWRICMVVIVIWGCEALHFSARHHGRKFGFTPLKRAQLHSGRHFKIHLGHTTVQDEPMTFDLTRDETHRTVHNRRWEDERGHESSNRTGLKRQGKLRQFLPHVGRDFKIHLGHTRIQEEPITYQIANDETHQRVHNQRWEDRRGGENRNERRNFVRTGQYY